MFFHLYEGLSGYQLIGWVLVFVGLVVANELARRTKAGGIFFFGIVPLALTVYFIVINIGAKTFAANNPTIVEMNGWFHYAKLYAATIGCVGFMFLKYKWGKIGKVNWFKAFPFVIVGINILIAVASDFESAIKGFAAAGSLSGGWWYSSEGVWLYGGWWNVLNGIAGLINIFCMTGCVHLYTSKDKNKSDMLWPDMTIWFIIAYDVWNFEYTYLNLPTHSWYCGVALLLAPTFANAFWNKGAWIQNRANTLAIWCMWAQVVPAFQLSSKFAAALPSVYGGATANGITTMDLYEKAIALYNAGNGKTAEAGQIIESMGITADPRMQGFVAILAIVINVICITEIIKRSVKLGKNPYANEVFGDTKDFKLAMERAE